MANPDLGQKQVCPECQAKFYDLNRRPAVCPKCTTAFDPEEVIRNRRVRPRAADYEAEEEKEVVPAKVEDEEGFEEEVDETPEIDDAAAAEPIETDEESEGGDQAAPAPGGDIGVDFAEEDSELEEEAADDVPFLEDEDDEEAFDGEDIEGIPGEDEESET